MREVPFTALPSNGKRVPIPFERAPSFALSLVHLEDEGPVARWSEGGVSVWEALVGLGEKQRDPIAIFATRRDHYQRQPEKLISASVEWIEARPDLADYLPYLWSFRLSSRHRIWGLLLDGTFHLLWNDPDHAIFRVDTPKLPPE